MEIKTPLTEEVIKEVKVGDRLKITGTLYTARDQAHCRLLDQIRRGEPLPLELPGQIIFYAGPTPVPKGQLVGAIGPTTSLRMDPYTVPLLELGLKGMIGKGYRSLEVKKAISKFKALYLVAVGGTAAYLSQFIKKIELLAYPDLGPEAIYKLEVKNFPVVVAIDSQGSDLFVEGRKKFQGIW
jgi:fumarate hydratase subunit beta